jgi:hypothetical protein
MVMLKCIAEIGCENIYGIRFAQDRAQYQPVLNTVIKYGVS